MRAPKDHQSDHGQQAEKHTGSAQDGSPRWCDECAARALRRTGELVVDWKSFCGGDEPGALYREDPRTETHRRQHPAHFGLVHGIHENYAIRPEFPQRVRAFDGMARAGNELSVLIRIDVDDVVDLFVKAKGGQERDCLGAATPNDGLPAVSAQAVDLRKASVVLTSANRCGKRATSLVTASRSSSGENDPSS